MLIIIKINNLIKISDFVNVFALVILFVADL